MSEKTAKSLMIKIYTLLIGMILYVPAVHSSDACPLIPENEQGIAHFLQALREARFDQLMDRYRFTYAGDRWYLEKDLYEFLLQGNIPERSKYSIKKIQLNSKRGTGTKQRCFYTVTSEHIYFIPSSFRKMIRIAKDR